MAFRVLSVNDLEMFYNFGKSSAFLPIGDIIELRKEITATGSGMSENYWNAIYGAHAFYQMATEMNITGVLPKASWARSGWRMLTDWAYTNLANKYNTYGIGETGTIDSIEAEPNVMAVKTAPKIIANSFSVSEVMETISEVDDNWGSIEQLREWGGIEHSKTLNMMLGERIKTGASAATDYYGNRILPLDAIITNADELNGAGATQYDVPNYNIYGINRFSWDSTNSKVVENGLAWSIPYVHDASKDSSANYTNDKILDVIVNARKRGANSNVILTGYDTYADIQNSYLQFIRYVSGWGETKVKMSVNGVETAEGYEGAVTVATLYGIPIIPTVNIEANANGKENIYLLDTSSEANEPRLALGIARPTMYFETADPFINNAFKVRGLYRTIGEVIGKYLYGQAKITNLS